MTPWWGETTEARSHGNDVSTAEEMSKQKFTGTPIIVYSAKQP